MPSVDNNNNNIKAKKDLLLFSSTAEQSLLAPSTSAQQSQAASMQAIESMECPQPDLICKSQPIGALHVSDVFSIIMPAKISKAVISPIPQYTHPLLSGKTAVSPALKSNVLAVALR